MATYDYTLVQQWALQGQPIREQIMAALLTRAQAYLPSATRDPIRRKESDLPRLVIADPVETRAQPTYKKHQLGLTVNVTLADAIDPQSETLGHQAGAHVAGILAAIVGTDRTLGGLCDGIEYESSTINYPDPGDIVFGVSLVFTVLYSVALGDPFNRS
jgi:hypothetical protein